MDFGEYSDHDVEEEVTLLEMNIILKKRMRVKTNYY